MSTSKIIPIEIDDIMETHSKQRGIIQSSPEGILITDKLVTFVM